MGLKEENSVTILTGNTAKEFWKNILYPDPEVVRKRDERFKKLNEIKITRCEDGSFTADIPWLEIPDFEGQTEEL